MTKENIKKKQNVFIHPLAVVETEDIGEGTRIWEFTYIMNNAKIGKFCNIASHCFIENGVEIGNYCTIKNGVYLWQGIILEDHVFIGPGVIFTNDKYPRSKNRNVKFEKTLIKENASIGAGAIILCGLTIGKFAMIGAGSVVTKSVPDFGLVYGNPAKLKGYVCVCGHPLIQSHNLSPHKNITCKICKRSYKIEHNKLFLV